MNKPQFFLAISTPVIAGNEATKQSN